LTALEKQYLSNSMSSDGSGGVSSSSSSYISPGDSTKRRNSIKYIDNPFEKKENRIIKKTAT
jgi:hypothetical protein